MGAVWMRVRAELRARLRTTLGLALVIGLGAGGVLGAGGGARRTDSAYERFLTATRAPDVQVPMFSWLPIGSVPTSKIIALTSVAEGSVSKVFLTHEQQGPTPTIGGIIAAPSTGPWLGRPRILSGRLPDPASVSEVAVGFTAAEKLHLRAGSRISVTMAGSEKPGVPRSPDVPLDLDIVGIAASVNDFPPITRELPAASGVYASEAFERRFSGRISEVSIVGVRLRGGHAAVGTFENQLRGLAPGAEFLLVREHDHTLLVRRSIHLQAAALWMLAGLLALAVLLVAGQALARQTVVEGGDRPVLRALGMTRVEQWIVGMTRALVAGVAAASVACALGFLLSPLSPFGIARTAEPAPGFRSDWALLGLGAGATIGATLLLAAWPIWRATRHAGTGVEWAAPEERRARVSIVSSSAGLARVPIAGQIGVGMALETGRGRSAVPVRSAITGIAISLAAMAAALGFGASLNDLLSTPRLYGDVVDATGFVDEGIEPLVPRIQADPAVETVSVGQGGFPVRVGSVTTGMLSMQGNGSLAMLEGRFIGGAAVDAEIVLGSETLRSLHRRVGDRVDVSIPGGNGEHRMMTVVGRAVFPPLSDRISLGKGAAMSHRALLTFVPDIGPPKEMIIRFRPGADRSAALDRLHRIDSSIGTAELDPPTDLVNFGRVDRLPLILAGGLAALGLATLLHTIGTSVRRRNRAFGIMKALGFVRRDVRRTVRWQSMTIAAVASATGIPVGVAVGRIVWIRFADALGVIPEPAVPIAWIGLVAVAALVIAALVCVPMAGAAQRLNPALLLRAE